MPAAKRNRVSDDAVRAKIRTTQLVKRLQCDAMGVKDDAGNKVELTDGQRASIKILLGKVLPDLSTVVSTVNVTYPLFEQAIAPPEGMVTIEHSREPQRLTVETIIDDTMPPPSSSESVH